MIIKCLQCKKNLIAPDILVYPTGINFYCSGCGRVYSVQIKVYKLMKGGVLETCPSVYEDDIRTEQV